MLYLKHYGLMALTLVVTAVADSTSEDNSADIAYFP